MFQANPKKWDIDAALGKLSTIRWLVTQYRSDITTGDRVFLWRSGPEAGVVALATVLAEPAPLCDDKEGFRYSHEDSMFAGERIRVPLGLDRVLLRLPISRKALLCHPVLDGMAILRRPQGTNFPLTDVESAELEQMCSTSSRSLALPHRTPA